MAHSRRRRQEPDRESWWTLGLKAAAGLGVLSASAIIAAEAYKAAREKERRQHAQQHSQQEQQVASTSSAQGAQGTDSEEEVEEKEVVQKSGAGSCDWSDYEEVDSDDYEEAAAKEKSSGKGRGATSSPSDTQGSGVPLMTRLEEYYASYVFPNQQREQVERDVLSHFQGFFMKYVRQHGKSLPIGHTFYAGDKSQVTVVKAYDALTKTIVVPIEMNPNTWEYVDARHSVMKTPGYFLVRRINLDFIPKGQDPWDQFMVGNYLCPAYVLRQLHRFLSSSIEEYCKMTSEEPPSLTIDAEIYAKLGPRVVTLTSTPYSNRTSLWDDRQDLEEEEGSDGTLRPDANLWLWSYNEFLLEMLLGLDGADDGCRMKCVAIMEALRVNNSKLQILSHAHLLAVMYIACVEETEWESHMLAERFFDVLVTLTRCLSEHNLPHPRDQTINCFMDMPSWALQRTHRWLQSILKNPRKISAMLKHKY